MKIEKILEEMNLEDKISLCSGRDFWHTKEIEQHGIPSIMMCDGPHGLRKQVETKDHLGINESLPATCFPTASLTACSWDPELLKTMGEAIAREAISNDVQMVLGPGANLKRNPLCGRNFEYFSEDPYLAGKMAAAEISGIEKTGVGSTLKHFALNNQEYKRFSSDSLADERTMRELYLTAFEIAVKEAKPSAVMSSYNKVNGVYSSDNRWLLREILRTEWGFDGLVVTDWGGMNDRVKAFEAGCNLMMPGGSDYMEAEVYDAVLANKLSESFLDESVRNILELIEKTSQEEIRPFDVDENFELARKIAEESAVLLKNEEGILPLENEMECIFVGYMAKSMRYQGSGSSHINPAKLKNIRDVCPEIAYYEGCFEDGSTSEELLSAAEAAAKHAKNVVIFAGLTEIYESEGFDREHMKMPEGHLQMIERVLRVNQNVIVVLMCGSPAELPWADQVKAILYMGLSGEAGAEAVKNLLFGRANPCGKLAETWPNAYEDCISSSFYGTKDAQYREGIYVGYRYYESANVKVRFPFGHGLSYTCFEYSDLRIEGNKVHVNVKNTGARSGKEVVQLYIEPLNSRIHRPLRELKRFKKIELQPGEEQCVTFLLDERCFAVWDKEWKVPEGYYEICIGRNSHEMILAEEVFKEGIWMDNAEELPKWYRCLRGIPTQEEFEVLLGRKIISNPIKKGSFTKENSILEMKEHSLLMQLVYCIMEVVMGRKYGGKNYQNPTFKMMMLMAADCSVSGMQINAGIKGKLLQGMVEIANGRLFKGIRMIIKRR